jgi:hypothetical protein
LPHTIVLSSCHPTGRIKRKIGIVIRAEAISLTGMGYDRKTCLIGEGKQLFLQNTARMSDAALPA